VTEGAFQGFGYGYMVWVSSQDAIYIMYDSSELPRWQVFPDLFTEGMPDKDPALDAQAPPYSDYQPRRGFGLIWRQYPEIRDRIGWAESAYEEPYMVSIQTRSDGTIFMSEPNGRVFALAPNGDYELY
jgi:hypothetical protein